MEAEAMTEARHCKKTLLLLLLLRAAGGEKGNRRMAPLTPGEAAAADGWSGGTPTARVACAVDFASASVGGDKSLTVLVGMTGTMVAAVGAVGKAE